MELRDEFCFCSGFVKALKDAATQACCGITLFLCRKYAIVIVLLFIDQKEICARLFLNSVVLL